LNAHGDNDVWQTEIHAEEPLLPEPNAFEVEMAIEKLKRHKSPGIDQIKAGCSKICSEIHKLVNYIWNKDELPEQWKKAYLYLFLRLVIDCNNYRGISLFQLHTNFYQIFFCQG
jgi:hypothetical protein